MSVKGASESIARVVTGWEGVSQHPHHFGGIEFRLGRQELGHLHGDSLLDIPFPKKVRDELVAAGRTQPHHLLPETGWTSFYLRQPEHIQQAIDLLQHSYELARSRGRRTA